MRDDYWVPLWAPCRIDNRWALVLTRGNKDTVTWRRVRRWHPYDLAVLAWGYYERRRHW